MFFIWNKENDVIYYTTRKENVGFHYYYFRVLCTLHFFQSHLFKEVIANPIKETSLFVDIRQPNNNEILLTKETFFLVNFLFAG